VKLTAGYAYSPTSLPSGEFLTIDVSAQDSQQDAEFEPDILIDEGIFTGLYTI
jgi:hypothetical protein